MKTNVEEISINGVSYVPKGSEQKPAVSVDGKPFVIIRSYGAGVFAGYLRSRDDKTQTVALDHCIRLHRWTGCSLSQVANDGVAGTGENRFSMPTDNHYVLGVIEIIPATEKARIAIEAVKTWKL